MWCTFWKFAVCEWNTNKIWIFKWSMLNLSYLTNSSSIIIKNHIVHRLCIYPRLFGRKQIDSVHYLKTLYPNHIKDPTVANGVSNQQPQFLKMATELCAQHPVALKRWHIQTWSPQTSKCNPLPSPDNQWNSQTARLKDRQWWPNSIYVNCNNILREKQETVCFSCLL